VSEKSKQVEALLFEMEMDRQEAQASLRKHVDWAAEFVIQHRELLTVSMAKRLKSHMGDYDGRSGGWKS
jgi:hypothetical protein